MTTLNLDSDLNQESEGPILVPLPEREKMLEDSILNLTCLLYNLSRQRQQVLLHLSTLTVEFESLQKRLLKQETLLKELRGEVKKVKSQSTYSSFSIPLTAQPSKAILATLVARMDLESRKQLLDQLSILM